MSYFVGDAVEFRLTDDRGEGGWGYSFNGKPQATAFGQAETQSPPACR
jgi:hypothetical protein